jgi:DNA helicase-4
MIEWLALGAIALLGGSSGSSSRGSSSGGGRYRFDHEAAERERAAKIAAWREQWAHEIDLSRWIPQSAAHRIAKVYPNPVKPQGYVFGLNGRSPDVHRLLTEFAAHNKTHLAEQKTKLKPFFDAVERNALTDEQTDACICMDDAVQVVAAAGSGKTSTMVVKTGYVLHEKLAGPEQILLLAFNNDAAAELRERIRTRLSGFDGVDRITVSTFHKFGLDVISGIEGKPTVADWLGSAEKESEFIVAIVDDLRAQNPVFGLEWDLFRTIHGRDIEEAVDQAPPSDDAKGDIRTANGDWVKSGEERLIADWLFYHGINYQYERAYEHSTRTSSHRQYRPDFSYPEIGLYHEHFALNGEGMPPPKFIGYLDGVKWKRELHEECGTELIETTSHGISTRSGLEALNDELRRRGLRPRYDASRKGKGRPPVSSMELARLIRSFQQHVKGGFQTIAEIRRRIEEDTARSAATERATRFLFLYERIADEWDRRLRDSGSIDFDDMLVQATGHIESGRFASPFTMIFADEFQDSSRARLRMLQALLAQTNHRGHLCVVGDDWQSINRFAGADLSVMTEFRKAFPHSSRLDLGTTFRCPAALCEASSAFIRANPNQLEKSVRTTNERDGQAIAVFVADTTQDAELRVAAHLEKLHRQTVATGNRETVTVLLLGRYRHNRPRAFDAWRNSFGDRLRIDYRTVHRSKGLEADYVMILGMEEGEHGFPSQIADDRILSLAMPEPEDFPMAEERRVFYVALTRARRQVRIYASASRPSRFLIEMEKAGLIEIAGPGGSRVHGCPKCPDGLMRRHHGRYGAFEACGRCDFKRNVDAEGASTMASPTNRVSLQEPMTAGSPCPTCGTGRMVERRKARFAPIVGCSAYPGCRTIAPLLSSPTD